MQADDVLRTARFERDFVEIECRRVAREDGVATRDSCQVTKDALLERQILEHGFHDEVRRTESIQVQASVDQADALLRLLAGDPAARNGTFDRGANACESPLQELAAGFHELHANPSIREGHCDAAAHGAGPDDTDTGDWFCSNGLGESGDATDRPFGEE